MQKIIDKLIYVSTPYESEVVKSQVFELLEYYSNTNMIEEVVLIQVYRCDSDLLRAKSILDKYKFTTIYTRGKIGFIHFSNPLISKLSKIINGLTLTDRSCFHVRTELLGYFVIKALKKNNLKLNVLVDIRGTFIDELNYKIKNTKNIAISELIYSRIIGALYADLLKYYSKNTRVVFSAVSNKLKQYLIEYGFSNTIYVNPNISNVNFVFNLDARIRLRNEFNIRDNQVVIAISSSGNEIWQKDREIIKYFLLDDKYVILNLSKIIINDCRVINMFLPHDKMPDYLSMADIGFVWRDENILNNCASPSKFSEFSTIGLYIIHNNTVDLISNYIINNNDVGLLIDDVSKFEINIYNVLDCMQREKRSIVGQKTFSVRVISDEYFKIYNHILNI